MDYSNHTNEERERAAYVRGDFILADLYDTIRELEGRIQELEEELESLGTDSVSGLQADISQLETVINTALPNLPVAIPDDYLTATRVQAFLMLLLKTCRPVNKPSVKRHKLCQKQSSGT